MTYRIFSGTLLLGCCLLAGEPAQSATSGAMPASAVTPNGAQAAAASAQRITPQPIQDSAGAASGTAPAPHAVPGWYLGLPVLLRAEPVPPGTERAALPHFIVYVHAPVSETAGAAALKMITGPDGPVALPPHQDTLSCANSSASPRLGLGYFVLRGTKGSEATVRTQPQPAKSWPRTPLVSAIRVGPEWVKVNSHEVVEYGIKAGLLQLQFFDIGGLMWAQTMDPAVQPWLASTSCVADPDIQVPPVDWARADSHQPGQVSPSDRP